MGTFNPLRGARWTRPPLATVAVAAVAALTAFGVTGAAAATPAGSPPSLAQATGSVPPGGTWGTSTDVPGVAALADAASSDNSVGLTALSCTAPGECVAVGSYSAIVNGSNTIHPYIASEVNGVWGNASEVTVPGANLGQLEVVSCPSAGNCSASGEFYPTTNLSVRQPFVIDEVGGIWQTAQPVTGMTSASSWSADARSISCGLAGDCALVGTYTVLGATASTSYNYAYVDSEVDGAWQPAWSVTGVPYPASVTSPESYLTKVSCGAAGDCAAGCGVFADSPACIGAVSKVVPVDLVIPGCPPTPTQLLQGLLALLSAGPEGRRVI